MSDAPMTDTAHTAVFPLPALVGQDDLVLALLLCAIDPAIGGTTLGCLV